jgi:phage terminase large subunit-like protein
MAILPYVSSGTVRLVSTPDTSLCTAWLQQLLAFDLGEHDDAVDATVAALEPLQVLARGCRSTWLPG